MQRACLRNFKCKEKVLSTLVNANEKLNAIDGSGTIDDKKYRSLIGGLLYLSYARPNIAHAIGLVSRFMTNPSKHHPWCCQENSQICCWVSELWNHV